MSDSMIHVPAAATDLTTEAVMADVRAVKAGDMSQQLAPQSARMVASWWQSSGAVGRILASFASGVAVFRDDLIADIQASRSDVLSESDHDELDALAAFVRTYQEATTA